MKWISYNISNLRGIFTAIFGGTRTQMSGPTGPMTVVSSLMVLTAIESAGSLEKGFGLITRLVI